MSEISHLADMSKELINLLLNRCFSLKADIAETQAVTALEVLAMFANCQNGKKRALFVPTLSYWTVRSNQFGVFISGLHRKFSPKFSDVI